MTTTTPIGLQYEDITVAAEAPLKAGTRTCITRRTEDVLIQQRGHEPFQYSGAREVIALG